MTTSEPPGIHIEIAVESIRSLPIKMYFSPTGTDIDRASLKAARPMADGSAFLYRFDGKLYLVTAGHNFSAKHAENDRYIGTYQTEPTHVRIGLRLLR